MELVFQSLLNALIEVRIDEFVSMLCGVFLSFSMSVVTSSFSCWVVMNMFFGFCVYWERGEPGARSFYVFYLS